MQKTKRIMQSNFKSSTGGLILRRLPRYPGEEGIILPAEVSFQIGAFCFDARQFGAFHFGDFHFDVVPVRRVSLWRASTSVRFSLARFPILYLS